MPNLYIAHIADGGGEQTVAEHCRETGNISAQFARKPLEDLLILIGNAHDIGKYQQKFQQRIRFNSGKVEHSAAGAVEVDRLRLPLLLDLMIKLCIVGHHSGLPDIGSSIDSSSMPTLKGRLKRKFEDYSAYTDEIKLELSDPVAPIKFMFSSVETMPKREGMAEMTELFAFWTRYCYSCLTDADSVDTMTFCSGKEPVRPFADFERCLDAVNIKLGGFVCTTQLQLARGRLQKQVFDHVYDDSPIKLINLPTGSGKTLCSIKYALQRLQLSPPESRKKRIIYIAPFNAIIDQTADVFDKLFRDCAQIVRHQSTFSYDDVKPTADLNDDDAVEDYRVTMKYACENWDCPIVITTMVQFFESLHANRRRQLRKVHNMADSIIIFDEAHMIPIEYLAPCLKTISYIARYLNSEILLLTATMPDYTRLIREYADKTIGISDLISDKTEYSLFDKCKYKYLNKISDEALLQKAYGDPSALIIVNSRKAAKKLYDEAATVNKYHLSTYMTAYDRTAVIDEVKEKLKKLGEQYPNLQNVPEDKRILLVSTSLIEAGVDLDFSAVYRELVGLDSILQSGGRCNREGLLKEAFVYIFEREESSFKEDVKTNITRGLLEKYTNPMSKECVAEYYDRLYYMKRDKASEHLISSCYEDFRVIGLRDYAKSFVFINDQSESIVVARDDESRELIESLITSGIAQHRKLQRYTASVRRREFADLLSQGVLEERSGVYILTNPDYYDEKTGIHFYGQDKYDL